MDKYKPHDGYDYECVIKMTPCYCITTKISKLQWDKAEKMREEWGGE